MDRLACWIVFIFILHPLMICGHESPNGAVSTNCPILENINISSNKNSVTLSWTPQSPYLISYYEIVYTYMQPCTSTNIPPSVVRFSGSLNQYTLDGLEEYSTYKLMHYIIFSEQSQDDVLCTYNVNTTASAPVWPPSNLQVMDTTNTTIMIYWEDIDCLHRNSKVTGYHIIYGRSSTFKLERNVSELIKGHVFTATDLIPGESYNFQVHSVNAQLMSGRTSTMLVVLASFNDSLHPHSTSDTTTNLYEITTTSSTTDNPEDFNTRLNAIIILASIVGCLILILIVIIAAATVRNRRMRRVSKIIQPKSTQIEQVVKEVELQYVNTTQTKGPIPLPRYQGMSMCNNLAYSSKTKQGNTALVNGLYCGDEDRVSLYVRISPPREDSSEEDMESRALKVVSPYAISPIVVYQEKVTAD